MRLITTLSSILLAAMLTCGIAMAQSTANAPSMSAADKAAFEHFRLTEDFLHRYFAVEDDIAKDPCNLSPLMAMNFTGSSKDSADAPQSLDALAKKYAAQHGVREMLKRHNMSAKQLIIGFSTLFVAAMQEVTQKHPEWVEGGSMPVSRANAAFFRAHKKAIRQHSRQLARKNMQTNGGKLPACLSG
jgi:hypothetical protein